MYTVGVSRAHDSAVALLKDGDIVFHLENERLSNIKHDSYPFLALLKIADYVDKIDQLVIAGVSAPPKFEIFCKHDIFSEFVGGINKSFFTSGFKIFNTWEFHHKVHAAHAFYNSGFSEAICLVIDGVGSEYHINDPAFIPGSYGRESGSVFKASYPANFSLISKHVSVPFKMNSLVDKCVVVTNNMSEGLAFQCVADHLGFNSLDAGKVMGMASYGVVDKNVPPIYDKMGFINSELFCVDKGVDKTYLNSKKFTYINSKDFQIQANLAHALQQATQQQIKNEILKMVKATGQKNVCLSGGYFLNCVANYEYLKDLPEDINIYVEPLSGDAGTSIGAAKIIWHETTKDNTIRKLDNLYLGLHHYYTHDSIKSKIKTEKIKKATYFDIAKLISEKNIVALFQGRSEAGPRALGNRSILYDPRDPDGKDKVNVVKKREWFRPFAGSVLEEESHKWFNMRCLKSSPFMMYAVDVIKEKIKLIPAITHVDGTCRIQTVNKYQNLHFYNLIKEFEKLTSVPILFNTSFNLAGDCIVETLDDALRTLRNSKIKYLYLPEFEMLIEKN